MCFKNCKVFVHVLVKYANRIGSLWQCLMVWKCGTISRKSGGTVLSCRHNWNKTERKQVQNCFEPLSFKQKQTLRPWNILPVIVNHSRCQLFARQGSGWGRNDDVRGYRMWLANTATTFHGCYSVSLQLKQNSLKLIYFSFVSVLFQFCRQFNGVTCICNAISNEYSGAESINRANKQASKQVIKVSHIKVRHEQNRQIRTIKTNDAVYRVRQKSSPMRFLQFSHQSLEISKRNFTNLFIGHTVRTQ